MAKRILIAIKGGIVSGGVEHYLINTLSNMNRSDFDIDLFVPTRVYSQEIADKLRNLGCNILEQNVLRGNTLLGGMQCFFALKKLLRKKHYDVIHVNSGCIEFQTLVLFVVGNKIEQRLIHSHIAAVRDKSFLEIMRNFLRRYIARRSTIKIGCSKAAVISLFGEKAADDAIIAKNGIDTDKFKFDENTRRKYRERLGIENKFVIGHVGRFDKEKNHKFLIEIFKRITEIDENAMLLLIGAGRLENEVKELVNKYKLTDKVVFAGETDKVYDYMCAMDIFVLPSLFEGFGMVNIEAQASGLYCVLSDGVPQDVDMTGCVKFLPLEAGAECWANEILLHKNDNIDRENMWKHVYDAGYDNSKTAEAIFDLYSGGTIG